MPWLSELPDVIADLAVREEDRARSRQVLMGVLARESPYHMAILAKAIARMNPPAADRAQAGQVLLQALTAGSGINNEAALANAIAWLDLPEEGRGRARQILLDTLADGGDRWFGDAIVRLAVTAKERESTRHALLGRLADQAHSGLAVRSTAHVLARLNPSADELGSARQVLVSRLAAETDAESAQAVIDAIASLAVTVEDRAQTRAVLIGWLASPSRNWPR